MKKTSRPLVTIGLSSLLLIFVSLCLITFAILSLVSARADYRLSSKIADRTTDYYEATSLAYERIAKIDAFLLTAYQNAPDQEAYYEALRAEFSSVSDDSLAFQIPINENQILSIVLGLPYPAASDDALYSIQKWQTVNISDWTPDTQQNLYQFLP